jgi:hypothetical protein
MATKLARLLHLQVLTPTAAAPRPRTVSSHGHNPNTRAAPAVQRKSRPILVCHWRPVLADGRLECRRRLEPCEGISDETPGESPKLSKTRPRRRITPRAPSFECGR